MANASPLLCEKFQQLPSNADAIKKPLVTTFVTIAIIYYNKTRHLILFTVYCKKFNN